MMQITQILLVLSLAVSALAANCTSNVQYNCPATGSFNVCPGGSLQNNIIIRCTDGCAVAGNCNDNLAGVPPVGVKTSAKCWQDSATAGDAQCTFDCVSVTEVNGSTSYPVGCSTISNSSSSSSTTSTLSTLSSSSTTITMTTTLSSSSTTSGSSTTATTGSISTTSTKSSPTTSTGGTSYTTSTTVITGPGSSLITETTTIALSTSAGTTTTSGITSTSSSPVLANGGATRLLVPASTKVFSAVSLMFVGLICSWPSFGLGTGAL